MATDRGHEGHERGEGESVQTALIADDVAPLGRLGLLLERERGLDLFKLEADKLVVAVAVAVVFDEKVKGLGLAAVGH